MISRILNPLGRRIPPRLGNMVLDRLLVRHEPEVVPVMKGLPRGAVGIDIGAWLGPWARAMAKRCDRVVAFEPNPATMRQLRRDIPANVELRSQAISDAPGTATLHIPLDGRGDGKSSLHSLDTSSREVEVEVVTLDACGFDGVSVVKVDVEGHEYRVLAGGEQLIASQRPVLIVEVEYRHSDIVDTTLAFFDRHGYDARVWVGGHWVPIGEFDLRDHQEKMKPTLAGRGYVDLALIRGFRYVNNLVAVHPDSHWAPDGWN